MYNMLGELDSVLKRAIKRRVDKTILRKKYMVCSRLGRSAACDLIVSDGWCHTAATGVGGIHAHRDLWNSLPMASPFTHSCWRPGPRRSPRVATTAFFICVPFESDSDDPSRSALLGCFLRGMLISERGRSASSMRQLVYFLFWKSFFSVTFFL